MNNITSRTTLIVLSALLSFAIAGCGSDGKPSNSVNTSNLTNIPGNNSASTAKADSSNPLGVTTPTPAATTNNAPTLTPVYKAYCAAFVKKDERALRRIYSTATIKEFEAQMKADGIKTLTEFLSDDQATNEFCEVRNEEITGETAVAEIRTKGYPNGIKVIFVKEGGEWKLTNSSPTVSRSK